VFRDAIQESVESCGVEEREGPIESILVIETRCRSEKVSNELKIAGGELPKFFLKYAYLLRRRFGLAPLHRAF